MRERESDPMALVPCSSESAAAEALLLLSHTLPPQPSEGSLDDGDESSVVRSELGKSEGTNSRYQSFVSGNSKPCSSEEIQALAAASRDVKLKVLQKNRSKIQGGVKFNSWKTRSGERVAMTTSFAASTASKAAGSSWTKKKKKKQVGSAMLRRKAILKLLSQGRYSEFKIRQTLGDSPDTSKALRLLLNSEVVKRTGAGGRRSPYIYTIA